MVFASETAQAGKEPDSVQHLYSPYGFRPADPNEYDATSLAGRCHANDKSLAETEDWDALGPRAEFRT